MLLMVMPSPQGRAAAGGGRPGPGRHLPHQQVGLATQLPAHKPDDIKADPDPQDDPAGGHPDQIPEQQAARGGPPAPTPGGGQTLVYHQVPNFSIAGDEPFGRDEALDYKILTF